MLSRVWGDAVNSTDSSHSCTILGRGSVSLSTWEQCYIFGARAVGLAVLIVDQFRSLVAHMEVAFLHQPLIFQHRLFRR